MLQCFVKLLCKAVSPHCKVVEYCEALCYKPPTYGVCNTQQKKVCPRASVNLSSKDEKKPAEAGLWLEGHQYNDYEVHHRDGE